MSELLGFGLLLTVGVVVVLAAALVVGILKLFFKLLVLPFALLGGLLKFVVVGTVGLVAVLVLGPILLGLLLALLLPLVLFGLAVWGLARLFATA